MRRALRHPVYARLFAAQVIALLGTGLLTVALGLLAYDIAGDSAGSVLGTALTIKMVAYVGVAPLIAAVVDRLPRKAVLVTADIVRLVVALALPLVSEASHIYLLVFVLQSASATFTPAFQSLIPDVLPDRRDYTGALALSRLAYDLESLISPVLAAALLTRLGHGDLFLGTAVGFAGSAALVLTTRLPGRTPQADAPTFWQRVPLGLRVFARTPTLRFLMLANVTVAAGTALVLVNSVVHVKVRLGLGDDALAWTLAMFGLGSLTVAVAAPHLLEHLSVVATMVIGLVVVPLGLVGAVVVAATGADWAWLLACWALLGVGTSLVATPSARLLADASTPADRNLVYTAQFALSHACYLVAYPIAGWVGAASLTGASATLLGLAAAAAAAAIGYAASRRLRTSSDLPVTTGA